MFRRFCDQTSLFVVTKNPKPVGADSRFNITLADGKPMLVGAGKVVESHPDGNNPFGRPGMKISFAELDDQSREILDQLNQARDIAVPAPPPPLPRHMRRVGTEQSIPPRSAELAARAESAVVAAAVAPAAEQRRQGSDFILPANPFGELTDASLEAFVECTLYEETSNVFIGDDNGASDRGTGEVPAWWPKEESATGLPRGMGQQLGSIVAAPLSNHPVQIMAPAGGQREDQTPNPGAAPLWAPAADHPASARPSLVTPGVMPPIGSLGQRDTRWPIAIAIAVALPLGLLLGFLIWGGGSTPAAKSTPRSAAATDPAVPPATTIADASAKIAMAGEDAGAGAAPSSPADAAPTAEPEKDEVAPATPAVAAARVAVAADQCAIAVTINTDGGTVYADGARLGATPFHGRVDCTTKQVTVQRPRLETVSRAITLVPGETTEVALRMQRPTFELQITSSPAKASAYVGGRSVGLTPVRVSVEGYVKTTVKVAKKGYTTSSQQVYPKQNPTRIALTLQSTAKPKPKPKPKPTSKPTPKP